MSGIVLLILRTAMALSLYLFLGWALWLFWRDLKRQQDSLAFQQVSPLNLRVEIGESARIQRFTSSEIAIGRDPHCECVIDSKTVSTYHARLSFSQGQWWVEDLESTNGTLLNQQPVTAPTVVASGDQLRCGEATITIEEKDQS
ncbi:MAG: FHA domain-containing protein [Chloroflexi bacterium]|nr:FHA domain-containing protein [Chloroflexota bacterium]